jgi:hypothetical protein
MSESELPEELTELVAAERARPDVDAMTVARVRVGASARIAAPSFFAWSWRARGVWLGLGLVAGIGLGTALGTALGTWLAEPGEPGEPPKTERDLEPPVAERPTVAPQEPERAPTPRVESVEAAAEIVRPVAPREDSLDAERVLLERARVLLRDGDPSRALRLLDRHATRHPGGALREEALALTVRAHLATGAHDVAQRAFDRLVHEYPTSLHRASLRRALSDAPTSPTSNPSP